MEYVSFYSLLDIANQNKANYKRDKKCKPGTLFTAFPRRAIYFDLNKQGWTNRISAYACWYY